MQLLSISLQLAQGLAVITITVIMSWVALGAAIVYFYYRQRKRIENVVQGEKKD